MRPNLRSLPKVLLVIAGATVAVAAPRLVAPSEYLQQDRYRSAVARIVEIRDDAHFTLAVVEPLRGEMADRMVLRVVGGIGDQIEVGRTYIIGHTDKPARRSPRWDTDPSGPRVLNVPAVGIAVFENSAAMRTLVREHPADAPLTDRRRLDALIEQLASADVQSRRFVLAELAIDAGLRELVGEPELEILRSTLASGELEPMAHDYLLHAARPMTGAWGSDWLAADCRSLVASHGPEVDLNSLVPALLVTALGILGETGGPEDAELARKLVPSNNPGVGKAAFGAMVALDPDLALEVADTYIRDETLHLDTRRFVQQAAAQAQLGAASD